jgi:sRNA-binding carbon storage regulator CsrA
MLVLTRAPGERIVIDGTIKIFGQICHGKIRFIVDAPAGVVVDREEVHARRLRTLDARAVCMPIPEGAA